MSSKLDANAEYIYEKLKENEDIIKGIRIAYIEMDAESQRHEKVIKEIKTKIVALQKNCPHWSKSYHPDPSGNNDSYYECDTCGAYI